jgi:hypothetical protein
MGMAYPQKAADPATASSSRLSIVVGDEGQAVGVHANSVGAQGFDDQV